MSTDAKTIPELTSGMLALLEEAAYLLRLGQRSL